MLVRYGFQPTRKLADAGPPPGQHRPGRAVIADGPAADTLFQRLPIARENERQLRAAQARRDRRDEFAAKVARGRRREVSLARAATGAAMLACVVAAVAEFVR